MKKLLAILAISIFICGCQKDLTECVDPQISRETPVNLTKEGILKFESQSAFDQCMNEIIQNPTNGIAIVDRYVGKGDVTRSNSDRIFNSVARIRADRETRAGNLNIIYDDNVVPEMTEEEFRDYIIDELLVDEELTYVLDSDLRIVVADTVYQITTDGVFIASYDNITLMEEVIDMYDPNMILNGSEFGYLTYIGEGRYQYRDVQIIPNPDNEFEIVEPINPINPIDPTDPEEPTDPEDPIGDGDEEEENSDEYQDHFGAYYAECENIKEYVMRAPTINAEEDQYPYPYPLDGIPTETENESGKAYNYFNNNVRIKARFYTFNAGFYSSIGFDVKLQRRKTFLGIEYWVRTQSEGIDVIIERLNIDLKCVTVGSVTPYGAMNYKEISGSLNGVTGKYIVRHLRNKIISISPTKENRDMIAGTIGSFDEMPINQILYNAPATDVYNLMHDLTGYTIGAPYNTLVKDYDVRTAMVCWSGSNVVHNYTTGVLFYPNTESNKIPKKVGVKLFDDLAEHAAQGWTMDINRTLDETIRYADITGVVEYGGEKRACRFEIKEIN